MKCIQTFRRAAQAVGAVGLLLIASAAVADAPEDLLLQGFEDLSKANLTGRNARVRAAEVVTEGAQAVKLAPKSSVRIPFSGDAASKRPWVMIDTATLQPMTQRLRVQLSGGGLRFDRPACVQPGRDRLQTPLSVAAEGLPEGFPTGRVTLTLTNVSASDIILDNVRLAAGEAPPKDAVLLDFGGAAQATWPLFAKATTVSTDVAWSGAAEVYAYDVGFPDPLTGDIVGRHPTTRVTDNVEIKSPNGKPAVGALWVTHYASRSWTQPTEYFVKVRGRAVLQRRISPVRMLGPEGLLEGVDGKWTPEWFSTDYAEHFAAEVPLTLGSGSTKVDVGNCQLAALAMAPTDQRVALNRYLKRLREDLQRYRRQFVAGERHKTLVRLEPTDEETKAGIIALAPPTDEVFSPLWAPKAGDRAETLKARGLCGGRVVVPLAAAPLRKQVAMTATLTPLRDEAGHALPAGERGMTVWHVGTVPRVREARIEQVPWLLERRCGTTGAKELVWLVAVIDVADHAAPGTYAGRVRVSGSGAVASVPIEITLHRCLPEEPRAATFFAAYAPSLGHIYHALSHIMPEARRDLGTRKLRRQLIELGLDSLPIDGPRLGSGAAVDDRRTVAQLRSLQNVEADGAMFFEFGRIRRELDWRGIPWGSQNYRKAMTAAVGAVRRIASEAKIRDAYCLMGNARTAAARAGAAKAAKTIASVGGKAAVVLRGRARSGLTKDAATALKPFAAVVLEPGRGMVDVSHTFSGLSAPRRPFIYAHRPDRFVLGFYAGAARAEGVMLHGLLMNRGPYQGFGLDGDGLLVPEQRGGFQMTRAVLELWEGRDDLRILRHARALMKQIDDRKLTCLELQRAIHAVEATAAEAEGAFDPAHLRSADLKPSELETLRKDLLHGMDAAHKVLAENN